MTSRLTTLLEQAERTYKRGYDVGIHLGNTPDRAAEQAHTVVMQIRNDKVKQMVELIRMQHEALRFASDEIKPTATDPYERGGDCYCPVCEALAAYERFDKGE